MFINASVSASFVQAKLACVFVAMVWVMAYALSFHWWQWLMIGVLGAGLAFWAWQTSVLVSALSAKNPADVWQLGVLDGDDVETWQAYLNEAKLVDMGLLAWVRLEFFVSVPTNSPLTVLVFRHQVDKAVFGRLSTLAIFGGYK